MTDEIPRLPVNGGSRPVPDPTELTDRAISRVEKALTSYIDGEVKVLQERLRGIDEATKLRLGPIENMPNLIDEKVSQLASLHDEKFRSVDKQFVERDTRSENEKRDSKVAVDAAFAAQKEAAAKQDEGNQKAIDKSERATGETIKTNQELNKATTDALTKSLDEVKLLVNGLIASKTGATESKTGLYAAIAAFGGVLGIIIAAVTIIALARPV